MNKEFIPYEQALELKELGFNEECLGYYHTTLASNDVDLVVGKTPDRFYHLIKIPEHFDTLAPLYQQAFCFFREKYGYSVVILISEYQIIREESISTKLSIETGQMEPVYKKTVYYLEQTNQNENSELECLKKLIEIVKNK